MSASVVFQPTLIRSEWSRVDAHGLEHRRRQQVLGGAGAPRVHGDAGLVEPEQHRLRFDAGDAEADEVRQPPVRVAVDLDRRPVTRPSPEMRSVWLMASSASPASRSTTAPAAAPQPTMAGTFSNPARRARSWSPPTSSGGKRSPRRTSSAPTPGGPPIL